MKRLGLMLGILALALIGLAVNSTADGNRRDCEDRLVGNLYLCKGVDRNDTEYEFELLFSEGNESSFLVHLFELSSNQTEAESPQGICACQAEGSLRRPRFDRSDDFICAIPTNESLAIALTGEADKKKIEDGQMLFASNSTLESLQLFYECKKISF